MKQKPLIPLFIRLFLLSEVLGLRAYKDTHIHSFVNSYRRLLKCISYFANKKRTRLYGAYSPVMELTERLITDRDSYPAQICARCHVNSVEVDGDDRVWGCQPAFGKGEECAIRLQGEI